MGYTTDPDYTGPPDAIAESLIAQAVNSPANTRLVQRCNIELLQHYVDRGYCRDRDMAMWSIERLKAS